MNGFVFRLLPPRPTFFADMSDEERTTMQAHVGYWSELLKAGSVLAFGPVNDPDRPHGIGIVVAEDLAAAEALRDADPAQQSPFGFRTEITPMLALVTPGASYPT